MLETLVRIGAVVGATTGFIAFALSATRTSRLRRSAQFLRETLDVVERDDSPEAAQVRAIVLDMHRAQIAEVIARQMTPISGVVVPLLLWLSLAALCAPSGYQTAAYLGRNEPFNFGTYADEALGYDWPFGLFLTAMVVLALAPFVWFDAYATLEHRAQTASAVFSGRRISASKSLLAYRPREENGGAWHRVAAHAGLCAPGLAALSTGFVVGQSWWIGTHPPEPSAHIVRGVFAHSLFFAFVFVWLTLSLATNMRMRLRRLAIPKTFPRRAVRRRRGLTTRPAQVGFRSHRWPTATSKKPNLR